MSWDREAEEIAERRRLAAQGDAAGVARQHDKGRLTIRERIHGLLDAGSFRETGPAAGAPERDEAGNLTGFQPANFLLGFGTVAGRRVVSGGEDFTVRGGSPTPAGLRKSVYAEELAVTYRVPLIRLHEGGGGSVAGTGGKAGNAPVGDPVFHRPRFRSVAEAFATVPVASAALGGIGAQVGLLLPYSRRHELEADRLGVDYMARAGYEPRQAIVLWEMMAARQGRARAPVFMSTHPTDADRIAALREYLASRGWL